MGKWVIRYVALLLVVFMTASCMEASHMIMEPALPSGEDVFATQTAAAAGGAEGAASGAAPVAGWPGRVRELSSLEPMTCDDLMAAAKGLEGDVTALLVGQYVADLEGLLQQGLVDPAGEPVVLSDTERDAVVSHLESLRDSDGGYCGMALP